MEKEQFFMKEFGQFASIFCCCLFFGGEGEKSVPLKKMSIPGIFQTSIW